MTIVIQPIIERQLSSTMDGPRQRAIRMLKVAADYIRKNGPNDYIHYDDADCDGHCVAVDCEAAANDLQNL